MSDESSALSVASTSLFVELVVVGVGTVGAASLVLASAVGWGWLAQARDAGPLLAFFGLPVAYVFGIVVDRLADTLGGPLGDAWLRRTYPGADGKRDYEADRLAVLGSAPLAARLDYGRSRLRVCRGWALNGIIALGTLAGYVLSLPHGQARLPIAAGGGLALVVLVAGCVFAWHDLDATQFRQVQQQAQVPQQLPE